MIHKIGMRTIKTALAVTISIVVANILKLEYPFYAAIAAIISMDKTAANSVKLGRNRLFGTFIGAVVGTVLSYIDRGNPILCGLGIIIATTLCNTFKLKGSVTISGVVLCAIMVLIAKPPLYYATTRIIDTAVGIGIAVLVNCAIAPYNNARHLDDIVIELWNQSDKLMEALNNDKEVDLSKVHSDMDKIKKELDLYESEIIVNNKKELLYKLYRHYEMTNQLLFEMDVCQRVDRKENLEVYKYHYDHANKIYSDYIADLQAKYVK